jgi:ATP phosphoribosyltransferase
MSLDVKIALPSKGRLNKPALEFLERARLQVKRTNERQYEAKTSHEHLVAIFQRASDIPEKIREGNIDLGITGFDIAKESGVLEDNSAVLKVMDLGFGESQLAIGIPDSWLDVENIRDLASLSLDWQNLPNNIGSLRVATEYPKLTAKFFHERSIKVRIIHSEGALEVAPILRSADLIVDTVSTGTTFRENRLIEINGGTILESQACLICNINSLYDVKYLFTWDNIEGKEYDKFLKFLKEELEIVRLDKIKIIRSKDNKSIRIITEEKKIEIALDEEKEKAILKIDDLRTYYLQLKKVNGRIKLYKSKQEIIHEIIDLMESSLNAKKYLLIMANVEGEDKETVLKKLSGSGIQGLKGPTISQIMGKEELFAINVAIKSRDLSETIKNIRTVGGSGILVMPLIHYYEEKSEIFNNLYENAKNIKEKSKGDV